MLETHDIDSPMVTVEPAASERATGLCVKPSSSMTARTVARVSGATGRVPLMTWDTVLTETPAALATIVIVTAGIPPSLRKDVA